MLRQTLFQRRGGQGPTGNCRNRPVRRKSFEGESDASEEGRSSASVSAIGSKPGEPHDRLQGATNLRSRVRRKPPKSGRTTRAEHVQGVATLGPRATEEWTHTVMSVEGRSLRNSKRGARDGFLLR
jgi:hypothetical protein